MFNCCGIKHIVADVRKELKWHSQLRTIEGRNMPNAATPFLTDKKILIIAPHADDELIGCHQLIINNKDTVTVFYCSLLGSNYSDENRATRLAEFGNYISGQGCNYVVSSLATLCDDLSRVIRDINPSYIFIPSYVDWQKEHRLVNEVLEEVLNNIDREVVIGWYHVSLPIPCSFINSFSFLTRKKYRNKWQAMRNNYKSQLHMDIMRFGFIERSLAKKTYAYETYIIMPKGEWYRCIQVLKKQIKEIDSLKDSLGNIKEMFEKTDSVYRKIYCQ